MHILQSSPTINRDVPPSPGSEIAVSTGGNNSSPHSDSTVAVLRKASDAPNDAPNSSRCEDDDDWPGGSWPAHSINSDSHTSSNTPNSAAGKSDSSYCTGGKSMNSYSSQGTGGNNSSRISDSSEDSAQSRSPGSRRVLFTPNGSKGNPRNLENWSPNLSQRELENWSTQFLELQIYSYCTGGNHSSPNSDSTVAVLREGSDASPPMGTPRRPVMEFLVVPPMPSPGGPVVMEIRAEPLLATPPPLRRQVMEIREEPLLLPSLLLLFCLLLLFVEANDWHVNPRHVNPRQQSPWLSPQGGHKVGRYPDAPGGKERGIIKECGPNAGFSHDPIGTSLEEFCLYYVVINQTKEQ